MIFGKGGGGGCRPLSLTLDDLLTEVATEDALMVGRCVVSILSDLALRRDVEVAFRRVED